MMSECPVQPVNECVGERDKEASTESIKVIC